jgi:hypothetical protein
MRKFLRDNGLSLAMFGLFFAFVIGLAVTGWANTNNDNAEHGEAAVSFGQYLLSGDFGEALFENWESEFLQMAGMVVLTALLVQKGSPESRMLGRNPVDREPPKDGDRPKREAPWPVRAGGIWLKLYEHSLTIALVLLFVLSFSLHVVTGAAAYSEEQQAHGEPAVSALQYLASARFWFESFQNWQSEFLAVGSLIVLTIFLRQRGSPESKPVDESNEKTGSG